MSNRGTPGAESNINQNLESHIPNRPFQFSSVPQGRGSGLVNGNNSTIAPSNKSYHSASSNLHRQAVAGSSSSAGGGLGTPSSEVSPANNTMKNEKDSNPSPGTPVLGTPGLPPNSTSATSTSASTTANGGTAKGRAGGGASDFVKKLYRMLEEDQYRGIVSWGSKGDSFIVKDMNEFTKTILPSHFKHSNFASFVRQLNKYDFHKVKNPEGQGDAPGENYWEFKHPSFTADQKHSLENIKRKITTNKKPETPNGGSNTISGPGSAGSAGGPNRASHANASGSGGVLGPIDSLGSQQTAEEMQHLDRQIRILMGNQRQIEMHLDRFSAQYQALMADLLGQHRAIAAQDAFTASMLQYMINLECRLLTLSNPGESPQFPPSADAQQLMATYSEISRSRYDKMTETTRRAEQLGLFVNGMRRATSPSSQQHQQQHQQQGTTAQYLSGGSTQQRPSHQAHLPGHMQQNTWEGQKGSPDFTSNGNNKEMISQTIYGNEQYSSYGYSQAQPYTTQHHPSHLPPQPHNNLQQQQQQNLHQQHPYNSQAASQNAQAQQTPLQHPHAQQAQQQYSYFPSSTQSHLREGQIDSPSTASESGTSFANMGEVRLGSGGQQQQQPGGGDANMHSNYHGGNAATQHPQQPSQLNQSSTHLSLPTPSGHHHSEPQMDYFPVPGSAPISSTPAITPGALMISTLNTDNVYGSSREDSQEGQEGNGGDGNGSATPEGAGTNALTQQNTNVNKNMSYPIEGEDIAAFAAALKGGQSSMAVRSALTSQPLLVRRATYIPGWSVPPRVLLVEDDAVCRNLTTKFLQLFGCTIEVASDGVEAVNKMQSGVYDICMMDVSMPNLDGVSATSLIRQFDAMTPIISMTGNSRPDEILTYFSHGMNDVLPKPFTKEGMLSMLEKHLIHLKQIHQNPEMLAGLGGNVNGGDGTNNNNSSLDNLDPNNLGSSYNPFFGLGLSNDEYQNILNGLGKTGFTPSPSPGRNTLAGGNASNNVNNAAADRGSQPNPGKRGQDDDNKDGVKRARFQEL